MCTYKQKNIFLIGPMGSGKSTIGNLLSTFLNKPFYDVDHQIEMSTGLSINDLFDLKGESEFRIKEEKMINDLTYKKGIVLATGGGSILSLKSRNLLSSRGIVIYLKTTICEQLKRVSKNKNRPLLFNNAKSNKEILTDLLKIRAPLYQDLADLIIDTSNCTVDSIISDILHYLDQCL